MDKPNETPETIYLIPDYDEGILGHVWCDDPAPGLGMDPEDAIEYRRADVADTALAAAEARIAELESQVSELQSRRENMHCDMLLWRGITPDFDKVCRSCSGAGIKVYGSTSTWRGGIGGQMMTSDVCDKCWGSGREDNPWLSHRHAAALLKEKE
jgi:hypothetical protein